MWLVGVVARRYVYFLIILLFATPLVLAFFAGAKSLLFCSLKKNIFVLFYVFVQYSKHCSKTFEIVQIRDHRDMAI